MGKKGKGRKRVKSSKKKKDKKKNGRNKKGKKNKKKGKTGKKGRNSKGKKKNKKKNKNKDKNKSEGRSTNESKQDPCPICVEKLRDLALVFGNQARNVYRQARRSLADIDMIAKKKSKEWRLYAAFESAFEPPKPDASNAKSTRSSSRLQFHRNKFHHNKSC